MQQETKPFLGFWEGLKRPFFVLAPLANVTDYAFRQFIVKYRKPARYDASGNRVASGGPDVLWTEFVAADGLCHPKGREALIRDLKFSENERPIVAQLFTGHPDKMFEAAKLVKELGFDGVDINMGCPVKNIGKQGAGADCIRNPELAQQVIRAAMAGVRADGIEPIPVSVKTRMGFNQDELESWLPKVLETKPAALTLHLRTKKEMSLVPAHWERMARAVELRNEFSPETRILGNGDVRSVAEARKKCEETGCDGVMIGRGVFGNPWLFDEDKKSVTVSERLEAIIELTDFFETTWGDTKSFEILKKHFQAYIVGFPGARELRNELMLTHEAGAAKDLIDAFLGGHGEIAALEIPLF